MQSQNSTVRALRILKSMRGNVLNGLGLKAIADANCVSQVNALRSLQALIDEGFVTKLDNGNYAQSIVLLQIATAYQREAEAATARIAEYSQRISRI